MRVAASELARNRQRRIGRCIQVQPYTVAFLGGGPSARGNDFDPIRPWGRGVMASSTPSKLGQLRARRCIGAQLGKRSKCPWGVRTLRSNSPWASRTIARDPQANVEPRLHYDPFASGSSRPQWEFQAVVRDAQGELERSVRSAHGKFELWDRLARRRRLRRRWGALGPSARAPTPSHAHSFSLH